MKRLLFVCVENSCRSQMAEGFAKLHAGDGVEIFSAGSKPSGQVNPKAVKAMNDIGYDLGAHASIGLDDIPQGPYDAVVSMGCGDACPHIPAKRRLDWNIPDPKHMDEEEFAQIRDLISIQVRDLLLTL